MATLFHILLLDDDTQMAHQLIAHLENKGHQVSTGSMQSVLETSRLIEHSDIIILAWHENFDMTMEWVLARLRALYDKTRIVFAVSPEHAFNASKAITSGLYAYILRPYMIPEVDKLLENIQNLYLIQDMSNQAVRDFDFLYRLNIQLSQSYDEDEILDSVIRNLAGYLVKDSTIAISLYNPLNKKLEIPTSIGLKSEEHHLFHQHLFTLASIAIQNRKTLVFDVTNSHTELLPVVLPTDVTATIVVPMLNETHTVGILYIGINAPFHLSKDDIAIAEFYATLTTVALNNARLIAPLTAITTELPVSMEHPRQAFDLISKQTASLLNADSCCILQRSRENHEDLLLAVGSFGLDERIVQGIQEKLGKGIPGRVANEGKPIINNNLKQQLLASSKYEENFCAILSVPIQSKGKILGTLDVHNHTNGNIFSVHDIKVLQLIAQHTASVIEHTELYGRWKRLISNAPEGIIGLNADGYVVEFNEESLRLLGYSADTIRDLHVTEIYMRGISEAQKVENLMKANAEGRLWRYPTKVKNSHGNEIPIRLSAILHYSLTGLPQGSFGYFQDEREFQALDEYALSLSSMLDKSKLYQHIVDVLARTLQAETVLLLRYDQRTDTLHCLAALGITEALHIRDIEFAIEGFIGLAFDRNSLFNVTQSEDPTSLSFGEQINALSQTHSFRECLIAPLTLQNEPFGVVLVINKDINSELSVHGFSSADESLLQTLSRYIVGLLQQASENAARSALLDVSTEIVSTIEEPDRIQQMIVDALVNTLGYRAAYFRLLDDLGNSIIQASAGFKGNYARNPAYTLSPGQGINGRVALTGQYEAISDVNLAEDYHFADLYKNEGVIGLLAVPIILDDEVIGTLSCYTGRPHNFTTAEIELVATFANLVAVTVEKAKQIQHAHERTRELEVLYDTTLLTSSVLKPNEALLEKLYQQVEKVMNPDGFGVFLYNPARDEYRIELAIESGKLIEEVVGKPILIESDEGGLTGWVIKNRRSCLIRDITAEELPVLPFHLTYPASRSWLGIPLIVKEQVTGVISVQSFRPHAFDVKSQRFLEALAAQIAITLHNAELFKATRRQLNELHLLEKAGEGLASVLSLDDVLEAIVHNVPTRATAEGAFVCLYDPDQRKFELDRATYWGIGQGVAVWNGTQPQKGNIIDTIIRNGVAVVTNLAIDTQVDESQKVTLLEAGISSFIGLSLKMSNRPVAILFINFSSPYRDAEREEEMTTLRIYADLAAVAIERAILYEDARRRAEELDSLHVVGLQLINTSDPTKLFQTLVDQAVNLAKADAAVLFSYDPWSGRFQQPVMAGMTNDGMWIKNIPKRNGTTARIVQNRQPTTVHVEGTLVRHVEWQRILNSQWEPVDEFVRLTEETFLIQEGIVCAIGFPLISGKQVLGVLFFNYRTYQSNLTQRLNNLEILASQAATALRQTKLVERVKQLHQIGHTLTSDLGTEKVLQGLANAALDIMGADLIDIYRYHSQEDRFELPIIRAGQSLDPYFPLPTHVENEDIAALVVKGVDDISYFSRVQQLEVVDQPVKSHSGPRFVARENILSSIWIQLRSPKNEVVGSMFINYRHEQAFEDDQQKLTEMFASYMALAVFNARLVERREIQALERVRALHQANQAITKAGLSLKAVFHAILEQAAIATGAYFGTIHLVQGDYLDFEAAWPAERLESLQQNIGHMPLNGRGITVRAIRENDAQLVPNVHVEPWFVDASEGRTRCELAVVFRDNEGTAIGVLNVEHETVGGLDYGHRALLIALSDLAYIALKNAQQYEELERTKDRSLANQAVAWLGLLGADWQHTINQKTFSISNYVTGLSRLLPSTELPEGNVQKVQEALDGIEEVVTNIRDVQFTTQVPPEPTGEISESTVLDTELSAIVKRWCPDYLPVEAIFHPNCPNLRVTIRPQWLNVAMEKLINNALKAMANGGTLTITTLAVGKMAHITIKDTGKGIPTEFISRFLNGAVPRKATEKGSGMGALIARFIALSHGGDLVLKETASNKGTTLVMYLPIVEQ